MLTLIVASIVVIILFLHGRKPRTYPPGPKPKPIVGNTFDIPKKEPWVKYKDWSKRFNSGIIHISAMGTHIIALNELEDVVALLEKRSAIYSSRPVSRIREMTHMANATFSLPYGNEWRKHRKIAQEGLKKDLIPSYHHMQTERVHIFLGQLRRDPANFSELCKSLGSSVTLTTAFGCDVVSEKHDRLVEMGDAMMKEFLKVVLPGSTLIHVFPFLRHIPPWVPGATAQRTILKIKQLVRQYRNEPYEYAKAMMAKGMLKDCLLANLLQRDGAYSEDILKDAMGTLYLGGGNALTGTQTTFIFAMVLNPKEQKKAQEEIDRVVGTDRLPNFGDRGCLPYIEALYREVLRWWPSHTTVQDDMYKGYHIPKGAMIYGNIWALSRDETRYRDPDSFMPERFFNEDGSLNDDDVGFAFGFGRRICVGRHLADSLLWLMIVSVLSVYNIAKAKDQDGNEIDLDPNGFVDAPIR